MAYVTTNQPAMLKDRIGGGGAVWDYSSADPIATVTGASYITDGKALGMKVGDTLMVYDTETPMLYTTFVSAVADAGATLVLATATAAA